jgi:branched-chain amino acid transport system permease protein
VKSAILDGIVLGLQYGLLGVGLTLIYGLAGVLNLAHGQVAVLGALVVSLQMGDAMPALPAILIGLAASGLLLVLLDLTIVRAVYRQEGETRVLMGLLLMLGVAFVIDGVLVWRYPIQQLSLRIGGDAVPILGVRMTTGSLLASAVTIVAGLVLVVFFRYSSLGRGVRSVIQDEEGARLCGVNPSAVRTFVFGVSGALACLVAVTRSMTGPIGGNNTVSFTIQALIDA